MSNSKNGLLITDGADISQAAPTDFVLDTRLLGGMHIAKILTYKFSDAKIISGYTNPTIIYKHGLGFAPAFLAFNNLGILRGHQNEPTPQDTVNSTADRIFSSFGTGSGITVIVFGEKLE